MIYTLLLAYDWVIKLIGTFFIKPGNELTINAN